MEEGKAAIFDLDGTLLDTLSDLRNSVNYCMEKYCYETKSLSEVRNAVGNGVAKLIERMLPDGRKNPLFDECLDSFREHYAVHALDNTAPYDGIEDMIDCLKNRGIRMAIVSNKFDGAVKKLNDTFFKEYISVAIGENEAAGIRKKPYPDTVFTAVKELGVKKENCIYIGDSEVDIQTASNSGMPCISVLWGFKSREFLLQHGAQTLCETPEELKEKLLNRWSQSD